MGNCNNCDCKEGDKYEHDDNVSINPKNEDFKG